MINTANPAEKRRSRGDRDGRTSVSNPKRNRNATPGRGEKSLTVRHSRTYVCIRARACVYTASYDLISDDANERTFDSKTMNVRFAYPRIPLNFTDIFAQFAFVVFNDSARVVTTQNRIRYGCVLQIKSRLFWLRTENFVYICVIVDTFHWPVGMSAALCARAYLCVLFTRNWPFVVAKTVTSTRTRRIAKIIFQTFGSLVMKVRSR